MSLNHREIDLVLAELDLEGARLQRVLQPTYDSIMLGLYKAGRETDLLISIAHGACRVHRLSSRPPKPERPLRFMECLRSRLRGGRLDSIRQLGNERILRIDFTVSKREEGGDADEQVYRPLGAFARDQAYGLASSRAREGGPETGVAAAEPEVLRYRLYARLWSGAGNIILCEEGGTIVDVLARRPKRGEISGGHCAIEEELDAAAREKSPTQVQRSFEPRDFPPAPHPKEGGGYNERVEAFYAASGGELSREKLLESARERFRKRERAIGARLSELEARAAEYRDADRLRELGDILMANQGLQAEGKFLVCEDFYRGGEISIQVDQHLSIVDNAKSFYERSKKARAGLADVEAEILSSRASLETARAELEKLERIEEPLLIARMLEKGGTARENRKKDYPGLSLERDGWTILVGRSAKENDELLRRHVRGSDLWLHARDFAGSYVFVKAKAGKSFPLEILLDAGNLAIYYSKGRENGGGELYYTFVKYLRRAKDGPKGLVLPTHEKNLRISLDEKRLKELRGLIGE